MRKTAYFAHWHASLACISALWLLRLPRPPSIFVWRLPETVKCAACIPLVHTGMVNCRVDATKAEVSSTCTSGCKSLDCCKCHANWSQERHDRGNGQFELRAAQHDHIVKNICARLKRYERVTFNIVKTSVKYRAGLQFRRRTH